MTKMATARMATEKLETGIKKTAVDPPARKKKTPTVFPIITLRESILFDGEPETLYSLIRQGVASLRRKEPRGRIGVAIARAEEVSSLCFLVLDGGTKGWHISHEDYERLLAAGVAVWEKSRP